MSEGRYDAPDAGPLRPEGVRALRPKPAATLILVRRDRPEPQVLMGRRAAGMKFMPGKWVFPGGRLDRGDYHAPVGAHLRPEIEAALMRTAPKSRDEAAARRLARALGCCAVRETQEEVGLLLETDGGANLAALELIARAITPPYRPRRFDARFFIADAERLASLEPTKSEGELNESAWFSLSDALELDLPSVTRFVLGELGQRLKAPERPAVSLSFQRGGRRLEEI
jgi:8-oxo-dGTP pyrophosphatase MutT (NUDIX family)